MISSYSTGRSTTTTPTVLCARTRQWNKFTHLTEHVPILRHDPAEPYAGDNIRVDVELIASGDLLPMTAVFTKMDIYNLAVGELTLMSNVILRKKNPALLSICAKKKQEKSRKVI